jgi:hypothetical protein
VGLFVAKVHEFIVLIEFLAAFVDFLVDLEVEDAAVEVCCEISAEFNPHGSVVSGVEVSSFPLRSAERYLIGVAMLYPCLPHGHACGAFLVLLGVEVAVEVVEVLHLLAEDVGQFFGDVRVLGADAAVHEAGLLLGVAVQVQVEQFF